MERRRGTLPIGNSVPNSVIPPHNLQPQASFASSNESAESYDSFQTQVPLPYHLPQDHPANYDYAVGGYSSYTAHSRPTGGSGKSLNPTSSPYIPTGNTPVLPSAGPNAQGWGASYMGGQNNMMASSYQQQGQQLGGMQYQNSNQYHQQPQMNVGGPVGGMDHQVQSQFGNNMGPYGHFGAVGGPINQNQFTNAPSPFVSYAIPEVPYATTAVPAQSFGMQYAPGVVNQQHQPANPMYNGRNNMYQSPAIGGGSFQSNPNTTYSSQMPGSSSFESAATMYSNRTAASGFNGGAQKFRRPSSAHSSVSSMRDQNKSYNSHVGKERNSHRGKAYRNNGNQRTSNSSTPAFGGPVQAKGVRDLSPEKIIAKSNTPESSRSRKKTKVIEDTSTVPTPVAKPHPSDGDFTLEHGRAQSHTPQLRSRRGQTIASAPETARKQSVSAWAAEVGNSSDNGVDELKNRGSPVKSMSNAMNMLAINESDPFTSPNNTHPFECMTVGPFNSAFVAGGPFSEELLALTSGGRRNPSVVEALDPNNLPFIEYSRFAKPDNWGVVKIKNIPYGVTRAEVLAFLGRNARIINESEMEPIHIVMERVTSKTLDCFVEFLNLGEAVSAVNRFETNRVGGKGGRLGQRHVEVELSTQGALLKELFPKAKNVQWEGSRPQIIKRDEYDPYNSGFQGFITKEELIMMVKHVETPQRSPFSKDCPQRPFECLISTLVKYPWYMVEHITIDDRNALHNATKTLMSLLIDRVGSQHDGNVNMNKMLLKRVWRAALQCPGFTPSMKDDIVCIAQLDDRTAIEYGLAPHASYWNKLWTIGPKPDVPVDVILWYIGKIRQVCVVRHQLSLAEQAEKGVEPNELKLFGDLDKHIHYGPGLANMSLAQVAKVEWTAIETALRRAFTLALPAN